ncbi:transient receptor potential cation channel protein painless-like isoform X2 [Anopheles bellator]|uniref:transient receptor potential cation channel protein painless-like isoform X2 n=1 Tax=Anopheles bellator TaxID=139047 RepID=UPI0026488466|nr:transient receptor potential cation channel protein painless-like isoform X2 [Anopheles bellator]
MTEQTTLVTVDEDSRRAKRQERGQLQKTLQESLAQATATVPTKESLQQLAELLADPRWYRLEQLVEEMKYWDAATTIPEPRSFLYYARQQCELHRLLTATAANHAYLRLIIERFGSDNERIAPDLNGPLHYAVDQKDEAMVEWLLEPDRTTDVNLRNNAKKSAITILCEEYDRCMRKPPAAGAGDAATDGSTLPRIRALIERLLEAGASFNVCSLQLKLPFELLLKHCPADEATRALVDRCVRLHKPGAIAICQSNEANVRVVGFYNNDPNVRMSEELLEIYLRYNDELQFVKHMADFPVSDANAKKVIALLLHTAIEQGLSECVRRIVAVGGQAMFRVVHRSRGVRGQPQKSSELVHRVELKGLLKKACLAGDVAVVQLLLSRMTDLLVLNDDPVLALTLTKAYDTKRRPEERHALLACAEFLTTQHTIYISKADNSGNTPLHLALKYGFMDVAAMLLDQRYAFIGVCNRDNLTPLDYGSYGFWKAYFDRCIKVDVERSTQDRNVLRFNLNCLEQPLPAKGSAGAGGAPAPLLGRPPRSEWKLVQQASADAAGQRNPQKCCQTVTEMMAVRKIAQSKELKRLLIHPVIYTFIMVKWMRLSHWTYLNLVLTTATVLLFGAYSLTACSAAGPSLALQVLAALGTVFMGGREVLQLLFLRQSYASLEQILDIVTVGGMCAVLWRGCSGLLASFVMISFAMQLTFLLGSLPFNSLSTIMYMFKTVSQNFLKSFLLFVPLIGAFVFAFHLTYNEPADDAGPAAAATDGNGSTEDSFNNFRTFWNATIKTLVMTTGEFEAASIDFSGGRFCLFIVFLFFAPIVILNLINGLAVSDIAAIREESELISISKKVMLLERYERGVASVQPVWLRSLFPEPFFQRHTCWIHVRTKESRKVVVHRLQAPAQARGTGPVPSAPADSSRPKKTKPVPLSLSAFSFLCPDGTDYYVNLGLFRFTTFMNLDRAILNEALAVIEKQHPVSGGAMRIDMKPLAFHESGGLESASSLLTTAATTRPQDTAQGVAALQSEIQELRATVRQVLDALARREPPAKRSQTLSGTHQQTKAGRKQKAAKKRQLRQELSDGAGD